MIGLLYPVIDRCTACTLMSPI